MSYGLGVVFVVLAALLHTLFSRTLFFGAGEMRGPIDWSELFYWGQWAGFWCAMAGMALFAVSAWRGRLPIASRRMMGPAVALIVCLHFVAVSIPEWSNRDRWRRGATGLRVYLEAKRRLRDARLAEASLKAPFLGGWVSDTGDNLTIHRDSIRLSTSGVLREYLPSGCSGYDPLRFERVSKDEAGYHFYRAGLLGSPLYRGMTGRDYPLLSFTCEGRQSGFVVTEPGRMLAVLEDGAAIEFRRTGSPRLRNVGALSANVHRVE